LRHVSLETNPYQLACTEAAASDVTATILLPVSPPYVAIRQAEATWCIWVDRISDFCPDTACNN